MTATAPKAGPRTVRAPRGTELSCKGWQQEAALRMLDEQPRSGGCRGPGPPHRLRRHRPRGAQLGGLRRHRRRAPAARERRDPAGPERQAGRRLPHHDGCAAGPDRQRQPRPPLGDLGAVPRAGARRPDDVRPDDGRFLDLHRDPGDHPGHLRDLRRGRAPALRRLPQGHRHPDRGPGRDGRRPAAGHHHERGRLPGHRGRPGPRRAAPRGRLRRRDDERPGRGDPQGRRLAGSRRGAHPSR